MQKDAYRGPISSPQLQTLHRHAIPNDTCKCFSIVYGDASEIRNSGAAQRAAQLHEICGSEGSILWVDQSHQEALIEEKAAQWMERPSRTALIGSNKLADLDLYLHIGLRQLQPVVWRRVKVAADVSLETLHCQVLAPAMGWKRNAHSYAFNCLHPEAVDGLWWGPNADSSCPDAMHTTLLYGGSLADDDEVTVGEMFLEGQSAAVCAGAALEWVYDLGDHWSHLVTLEKVALRKTDGAPELLDGWGHCPPEDIGGIAQYALKLNQLWPAEGLEAQAAEGDQWWQLYNELRMAANIESFEFDPSEFSLQQHRRQMAACCATLEINGRRKMSHPAPSKSDFLDYSRFDNIYDSDDIVDSECDSTMTEDFEDEEEAMEATEPSMADGAHENSDDEEVAAGDEFNNSGVCDSSYRRHGDTCVHKAPQDVLDYSRFDTIEDSEDSEDSEGSSPEGGDQCNCSKCLQVALEAEKKAEREREVRLKVEQEKARLKAVEAEQQDKAKRKADAKAKKKQAQEEERVRKKAEAALQQQKLAEEEEARRRAVEEERARRKAIEDEAKKKRFEEEKAKKKQADEEKALRKQAEEEKKRRKAEQKAIRRKAEEEEQARKRAIEEEARQRRAVEEREKQKKAEEDRARKKALKVERRAAEEARKQKEAEDRAKQLATEQELRALEEGRQSAARKKEEEQQALQAALEQQNSGQVLQQSTLRAEVSAKETELLWQVLPSCTIAQLLFNWWCRWWGLPRRRARNPKTKPSLVQIREARWLVSCSSATTAQCRSVWTESCLDFLPPAWSQCKTSCRPTVNHRRLFCCCSTLRVVN